MMVRICKNLEYNKIIQLHNGLSPHLTHSVISSAADPGGGSGGSRHDTLPLPPITRDTRLRLTSTGLYITFTWLILFNEMHNAFCH